MLKRRVLAWLFVLCFILSSLSSAAWAVEIPTLDDMGIDPWADLDNISGVITAMQPDPTSSPVPALAPVEIVPAEDLPAEGQGSGEEGIIPFSLPTDTINLVFSSQGFVARRGSSGAYFTSDTFAKSASNSYTVYNQSSTSSSQKWSFEYNTGAYLDYYSDVEIGSNVSSVTYSGTISLGLGVYYVATAAGSKSKVFYPTGVSLIVNGNGVGDKLPLTSSSSASFEGDISVSDYGAISTLGFRFYFGSGESTSATGPGEYSVQLMFGDRVVFTNVEGGGGPTEGDKITHGLLGIIIELVRAITNGVGTIILKFGDILTAITELPGKLATLIIDGIKSLFLPTQEDLEVMKTNYQALLSDRLGFIWQAGEWITSFGGDLLSALSGGTEADFVFPGVGFDMNGSHYQLIEQQTVDFDSNGIVMVIRPFTGTIVALIVVIAFINLAHDMVAALISGKSYADFLRGEEGS